MTRIALVPGVLALRPEYASLTDPVADLRAAVDAAVAWADQVFVGNGSAKRTEKAPGHFDERAAWFDDWLREALTVDPLQLASLDRGLAAELWADVDGIIALGEVLAQGAELVSVDYDDAPYGVKYWVISWEVA